MKQQFKVDRILEQIAAGSLSSEEGFQLYTEIKQESDGKKIESMQKQSYTSQEPSSLYFRWWWEKSTLPEKVSWLNRETPVLILIEHEKKEQSLIKKIPSKILVKPGDGFKKLGNNRFEIDPQCSGDYQRLASILKDTGQFPSAILHLWIEEIGKFSEDKFYLNQDMYLSRGVNSIYYLLRAFAGQRNNPLKRFIFVYEGNKSTYNPYGESVSAYSRSLQQIYPDLFFSTFKRSNPSEKNNKKAEEILWNELLVKPNPSSYEVLYAEETRWTNQLKPLQLLQKNRLSINEDGVYLITGGWCGLGLVFAKYLAQTYRSRLILTGRSPLNQIRRKALEEIEAMGTQALYIQADTTDLTSMQAVMEQIRQKFGQLNGIIHSAAAPSDETLLKNKKFDLFLQTLKPKIQGSIVLDQITKNEKLDFFVLFSSLSSIMGDFGQCDYAVANRFLDSFAGYREELREQGKRWGKSVSINWPLWREGGKHIDKEGEALYLKTSGMKYLETHEGVKAFETALTQNSHQISVAYGDRDRLQPMLNSFMGENSKLKESTQEQHYISSQDMDWEKKDHEEIFQQIQEDIKRIVSAVIKINPERLEVQENFGTYGFDSINLKELSTQLNNFYGIEISPTTFFHHSNIESLADHLLTDFEDGLQKHYSLLKSTKKNEEIKSKPELKIPKEVPQEPVMYKERKNNEIAIIGISGIFPGSRNLEEFWDNLCQKKNMISEIPLERWNWRDYYSEAPGEENKSISKWGGFIEGVDEFDANFFNFSRREAELMDPQQRLLIQASWKACEDAGYSTSNLSGQSMGVFIGAESGDYAQLLRERGIGGPQMGIGNHHAVLSNRISFILNLRGASETINTGCSSSLVAVNRAVRAIENGECQMALAGGITLILSPKSMISASQMGILSRDGRCKTFDRSANGYVRGEGVGIVMLKPIDQAIADHDHIYAIIKSTAVNHGGKANSFTAPNSEAQAKLLLTAYKNGEIDPNTISYIEAHGTGTELGDPVEVDGLKQAFEKLIGKDNPNRLNHYCGLGTVKTNIGHLEPASGIAGLIKVCLALKHKTLPANLHFQELNPYINLSDTPFYILDKTKPWNSITKPEGKSIPRRAGISSFGFGGTNAHVVLEEYSKTSPSEPQSHHSESQIILLSAKNKERLRAYAEEIKNFLNRRNKSKESFNHNKREPINRQEIEKNLQLTAASVLKVSEHNLEIEDNFSEYGFDAITLADFISRINQIYDIDLPKNMLSNPRYTSQLYNISSLTNYLLNNYSTTLRSDFIKKEQLSPQPLLDKGESDLDHRELKKNKHLGIHDLAYTLQVGREPMEERLAIVVSSLEQIQDKLSRYCRGETGISNLYQGNIIDNKKFPDQLFDGQVGENFINNLIQRHDFSRLAQLWVRGVNIQWNLLYPQQLPYRKSLPTYPFAKDRYWLPEPIAAGSPSVQSFIQLHPLIDGIHPCKSPEDLGSITFYKKLYSHNTILDHHQVQKKPVFPGVAYLEMVWASLTQINLENKNKYYLANLFWLTPLIVEKDSKTVTITIKKTSNRSMQFEINSKINENGQEIHSKGEILPVNSESSAVNHQPTSLSIEDIKTRCNKKIDQQTLYKGHQQCGIHYGPFFQGLQYILLNNQEALGYIQLPQAFHKNFSKYYLHPSLMDSAFQTLAGIVNQFSESEKVKLKIPFAIQELEVFKPITPLCYAYVKAGMEKDSYNIAILDKTGKICIKIHGLQLREYKKETTKAQENQETLKNLFYKPQWVPTPLPLPPCNTPQENEKKEKTILVISPLSTINEELTGYLTEIHRQQKNHVIEIFLSDKSGIGSMESRKEIDTYDPKALDLYIKELKHVHTIYFFCKMDMVRETFNIPSMKDLDENQEQGVISLFRLVKALNHHGYGKESLNLKVITHDVHPVKPGEINFPYSAGIHGFTCSMAKEFPNWAISSLDISLKELKTEKTPRNKQIQELISKILTEPPNKDGDESVIREGLRYKRTLVPIILPSTTPFILKEKGVYLILGGAGGIGLELSQYLVEIKQARLILLGRSSLKSHQKEKIKSILSKGGEVLYIQTDAVNKKSIQSAIAKAKSKFGTINGAIHSAIVLNDQPLTDMDEDSLRTVMAPKVNGSVMLYNALKDEPLDFFVFFSSAQSFVGYTGQANYAAGCTFKDAFALHLAHHASYPVKIINWGYWGNVGIVSSEEYNKRLAAKGIQSISIQEGMETFIRVLHNPLNQIIPYKLESRVLNKMGIDSTRKITIYPKRIPDMEKVLLQHLRLFLENAEMPDIKSNKKASTALEEYIQLLLLHAFQRMGVFQKEGHHYHKEKLKKNLRIIPNYYPLYKALLDILEKSGYIKIEAHNIHTLSTIPKCSHEENHSKIEKLKKNITEKHPTLAGHAKLLQVCLDAYPQLLTGQINHTQVMFPNGSMELVSPIYKGNRFKDFYNRLTAQLIKHYVQLRLKESPVDTVRILEAGAGTGGTSAFVLEELKEYSRQIHYIYTDISTKFIHYGKEHYNKKYPFIEFQVLDIEKSPLEQDFQRDSIDIILATDVVHATRKIIQTLKNIKTILKTNGLLILNEAVRNQPFGTLTFGLTDGWWHFQDDELRIPGSPLLNIEKWRQAIETAAFQWIPLPKLHDIPVEQIAQHIIIGKSNGEVEIQDLTPTESHFNIQPQQLQILTKEKDTLPIKKTNGGIRVKQYIQDKIIEYMTQAVGISTDRLDPEKQFSDYGVDSIVAVELVNKMNKHFDIILKTVTFFDYPNVVQLRDHIFDTHGKHIASHLNLDEYDEDRSVEPQEKENEDEENVIFPHSSSQPDIFTTKKPKDYNHNQTTSTLQTESETWGQARTDTMHEALILTAPSDIESIKLSPFHPTEPDDHEVQILVKAFSLNFGDLLCVRGLYPNMPEYPFTPGNEVSGTIIKIGKKVKNFKCGEDVIGLMGLKLGGHSSLVNTAEQLVVKKPENLSYENACAFPSVFLTMYHVFETAKLQKGEKILIQTAAGGTGLIAVQLALLKGAEIFATASTQEKLDYLKNLGVHHVINYRSQDFAQRILEISGNYGVDVVINTLSGDAIQKGIDILAPGGRYLEIAMTGLKTSTHIDLSKMVDNQTFYSIDLRRLLLKQPEKVEQYLEIMVRYLQEGKVKPTVSNLFPLSSILEAYRCLENRRNIGKVVVTVSHPHYTDMPVEQKIEHQIVSGIKNNDDIAIIGMSAKFPGAENTEEFWKNLSNGQSAIVQVPKERWDMMEYYDPHPQGLGKINCKWGGFLKSHDAFDPDFFNVSDKEAELMDPQQRLFLEESWNALEDAGYANEILSDKKCGVFVGAASGDYLQVIKQASGNAGVDAYSFLGNVSSGIPARIAYFLNLKGPTVSIDTACSSSLSAIHLARCAILAGDCDMAVAGGVFVMNTPDFHISAGNANMLSPQGQCKAFDDAADGFVPGEGVGAVVLKPLSAAMQDGDHIYALIKGSGMNQDGKTMGITSPSSHSQANLETSVYEKYGINPENISYVEAHGTGTKLGDTIEIEALSKAFKKYTSRKQYCAVSSVKTNIGHAGTAAGMAGVIKVLLALRNKQLPPSLHLKNPNQYIDFKNSPFYINTELKDWPGNDQPRQTAINAFGFNGANAHLVLQEAANNKEAIEMVKPYYFIPISARTSSALNTKYRNLKNWLDNNPEESIHDIAYTLMVRRKHFSLRSALIVKDYTQLKHDIDILCSKGKPKDYFIGQLKNSTINQVEESNMIQYKEQLLKEIRDWPISEKEDKFKERLIQVAELYINDHQLDWRYFFHKNGNRCLSLPTYPFEHRRFRYNAGCDSIQAEPINSMQDNELLEVIHRLQSGEISITEANILTEKKI